MAAPQNTTAGLTVTDHGDGSYTIHRSGTASDPAFARWLGTMASHEQVGILVRLLVEGKRGKNGEYRPVTVESIRFRPATLNAASVWLGPYDSPWPVLNSDWS